MFDKLFTKPLSVAGSGWVPIRTHNLQIENPLESFKGTSGIQGIIKGLFEKIFSASYRSEIYSQFVTINFHINYKNENLRRKLKMSPSTPQRGTD